MKNPYVRVTLVCLMNILMLALLFKGGFHTYIESSNTYIFAFSSIVGSMLTIAPTWLFYRLVDKKPLHTMKIKLNREQSRFSILSILVTVGLFFIFTLVLAQTGEISAQFNNMWFSNWQVIPMFLISMVSWFLVAFNEEILFRGYILANLKHLSFSKLMLVSGLFFSISHIFVDGLNPIMIVVTLSASLTLMYVYVNTGSLMSAIIPHLMYDFLTRQLIADSEISIIQFNGTPSDVYFASLHVMFLGIQIVLVKVIFKKKVHKCLVDFKDASSSI